MKITAISAQKRDSNRVNVYVEGKYRFSLDDYQLVDLGVKVGNDYGEEQLIGLENESRFGKAYARTLEYCLLRPHSQREIEDYLRRKTKPKLDKNSRLRPGITPDIARRVVDRLIQKGYINDEKFARFWVENRFVNKGISTRKLRAELYKKGVSSKLIETVLDESERNDENEIEKIIEKKRSRYTDESKLIAYLARQGFDYDDIKNAIKID